MKLKNKGFSLVELIVSFVIISILSIAIFRTVLSLQSKQLRNIAYNGYLSFQTSINNPIQTDFTTNIIESVEFCGRNCYKIKYVDAGIKELSIDTELKTLKYGDIVEKLPNTFTFYKDLEINEDEFDITEEGKYNSIISFRIPIKSTALAGNLDLIYAYQYDNRTNVITSVAYADYTDYAEAKGVNAPKLTTGLIPIKWDGKNWIKTTANDDSWYSYTSASKKWANAVTIGSNNKIVTDSSNNKYNGILRNGASFSNGGLTLDGVDDYVELPTLPSTINWKDGITIEYTAKWDAFLYWSRIFDFGNGPNSNDIVVSNNDVTSGIRFTLYNDSTGANIIAGTASTTKNDYKIEVIKNGANYDVKNYLNGSLVQTVSQADNNYLRNINRIYNYIGKSNWPSTPSHFDGTIYSLKITQANGTKIIDFDFTNSRNYYDINTDTNVVIPNSAMNTMWVWIPRYAYKITSGYHTSTAGTIDTKFLIDNTNTVGDGVTGVADTLTGGQTSANTYVKHPAFKFGTTELTGIWVAKFESTAVEGVANGYMSDYTCPVVGDNVTTKTVRIIPNVVSWRCITIGNAFTVARNMETNNIYGWGTSGTGIDTHLIKNIEWGAVAYLSKSKYGKDTEEIYINNNQNYIVGCSGNTVSASGYNGCQNTYESVGGVKASTTGNISGIYDLSGSSWEFVSAYVNNAHGNLNANGPVIINADVKYKDIYSVGGTDNSVNNYALTINKNGEAVYETSNGTDGNYSWFGDFSYTPNNDYPWFNRGGFMGHGTSAGVFGFSLTDGANNNTRGFRPVLVVGSGL